MTTAHVRRSQGVAAALVADAVGLLDDAGLDHDPFSAALRAWLDDPAGEVEPAWDRYYAPGDWAAPFLDRVATTRLAATGDLAFGVFVVSPDTFYPEHGHDARELYLSLGGDSLFLGERGWVELRAGAAAIQEPGVVHALRTRTEPATIFWAWTGAVGARIWARDGVGRRFFPASLR